MYVGSSSDVFKRWWQHANTLNHGRHHAHGLQELWLESGVSAFTFVVLESCAIEDLPIREQEWLDSFDAPLNASRFAACPSLDPQVAEKGAAKRRGRKRPPEVGAKIAAALRGQPHSEARKRNISAARTGKPITEAMREHLAKLHALTRSDDRRYRLSEFVKRPEVRQRQQERHWSRSSAAVEIGRRISLTKLASRASKENPTSV